MLERGKERTVSGGLYHLLQSEGADLFDGFWCSLLEGCAEDLERMIVSDFEFLGSLIGNDICVGLGGYAMKWTVVAATRHRKYRS